MIRNYPITIGIGYIGPTDACLTMSNGFKRKEFLIESPSWQVLDRIAEGHGLPVTFNNRYRDYLELYTLLYSPNTHEDERYEIPYEETD
jgi:hypothetical protein